MAKAYFPFGYLPPKHFAGWYFANLSHGLRVYRGIGSLAAVDFDTPVGFAQPGATSITLVGLGHAASTRYTYVARPVCGNGWLETPDFSCRCQVEMDADADWVGTRPGPVEWLTANVEAGGQITLRWRWRKPYGAETPADFCLYYGDSPSISPGNPQATVDYDRERTYTHTFSLTGGQTYHFAVTARSGGGVESQLSEVIGPYLADATAPAPPTVSVSTTF